MGSAGRPFFIAMRKGGAAMAALHNPRYERFCQEYVIDYNGTQAAIRAGYSKKSAKQQASRLLTIADILARVRELQGEQAARLCISSDWVVMQLVETVKKAMQAVPVEKWDYDLRRMVETGEYLFDSRGATKALELIGKHLGMYIDKVETNVPVTIVIKDDYGDDEPD